MPEPPPIPYAEFGGSGPWLHFAHANGYPPIAYRPLLENLGTCNRVLAMEMRPLWKDAKPGDLADWRPLAQDLIDFLAGITAGPWIGVGHSVGGNATLRAALHQPGSFKALVLVDPVLFPPYMSPAWEIACRLGLATRLHPLARGALRRRRTFESKAEMFANYRGKAVFKRLDNEALQAYVDAVARQTPNGEIELAYPPEWEARIYVTAMRADLEIWRGLPALQPPVLVLRGEQTDTFLETTARRFQRVLPAATIETIPDSGHLLPLEKPAAVAQAIQAWLDQLPEK